MSGKSGICFIQIAAILIMGLNVVHGFSTTRSSMVMNQNVFENGKRGKILVLGGSGKNEKVTIIIFSMCFLCSVPSVMNI